ncbi:MAG: ferredoxin [Psychromonas sp.]|jgi:ferredoxin|uniref:class I ribonucleotide reductase maintenance protein YfaE n=1 Tax=Psychromonas sp. TaxID=1884585 RepID=UPI0039E5DC1A
MSLKLTVNGIEYPLDTQKTLLENLEAQEISVEYHCRDGYCGACRCQLHSGEVEYKNDPLAYYREGEVLTCCSTSKDNIRMSTY